MEAGLPVAGLPRVWRWDAVAGRLSERDETIVRWERGGVEIVDRHAGEWRELCEQSPDDHPFSQPEWVRAFLSAFAPDAPFILITVRKAGRLLALLPLIERRQSILGVPITVFESPANVHSCRFDLVVCGGPDGTAAVKALWNSLKQHREWGLIALHHVPQDGAAPQLLDHARQQGHRTALRKTYASPYFSLADFTGDWEAWLLGRLKGDFRRELRRRKRKLEAEGEVRLVRVGQAQAEHLQRFYDLEASGWKGGEGTAIGCDPVVRHFYDEVAGAASSLGYLALYFLEIDGRPIAAHFGLTHGNRYFVPKLAFDERYAAVSPGHLLVKAVARDCAERGLIEFDFLGEQMEWKACWSTLTRQLCSTYIFNDTRLGWLLHASMFGVKSAMKNMLGILK